MPTIVNIFTSCAKLQLVVMKKTFLILLFMGLMNLIPSCNPCGDDGPSYFKINDVDLQFGRYVSTSGSRRFEISDEEDTLKYDNAYFLITPTDTEYVLNKNNDYFIGNALYACSPVGPKPAQKIVRISITSPEILYLKEKVVPPNELLSRYFYMDNLTSIVNFIASTPYIGKHLRFRLNTPPARMINQPFRFVIEMDDGKVFDLTTDNIKIAAD